MDADTLPVSLYDPKDLQFSYLKAGNVANRILSHQGTPLFKATWKLDGRLDKGFQDEIPPYVEAAFETAASRAIMIKEHCTSAVQGLEGTRTMRGILS